MYRGINSARLPSRREGGDTKRKERDWERRAETNEHGAHETGEGGDDESDDAIRSPIFVTVVRDHRHFRLKRQMKVNSESRKSAALKPSRW